MHIAIAPEGRVVDDVDAPAADEGARRDVAWPDGWLGEGRSVVLRVAALECLAGLALFAKRLPFRLAES